MDSRVFTVVGVQDGNSDHVKLSELTNIAFLGRGGYGEVYLVKDVKGNLFAHKTSMRIEEGTRNLSDTPMEVAVMLALPEDAPFLLKLKAYLIEPQCYHLLLQYAPGRSLRHLQNAHSKFSERTARFFIMELVLAVEAVHSAGYAHGDLSLDNILLDEDGHILLCDFGLSRPLKPTDNTLENSQKQSHAAARLRRFSHINLARCDFWQLGALIYVLLTGQHPNQRQNVFRKNLERKKVMKSRPVEKFPLKSVTPDCKDLLDRLLDSNPERRLSEFAVLKAHTWFKGKSWEHCRKKKRDGPFKPLLDDN